MLPVVFEWLYGFGFGTVWAGYLPKVEQNDLGPRNVWDWALEIFYHQWYWR